jgi:secreted trypsin-like serine protease
MKRFTLIFSLLILFFGIGYLPRSVQAQMENPPHARPTRPAPTPTQPPDEMQPQIIGGNPADDGEYPWQVALVGSTYANPYDGQFCGGSIIAPGWVLTAAHCVVDDDGTVSNPASLDVVAGVNLLSSGPTFGTQGQRRKVAQIIVYSSFYYINGKIPENDIALLRLAAPLNLNPKAQPISLATQADSPRFAPGVTATVSGWGRMNQPPQEPILFPDALMDVQVPIVDQIICSAAYAGKLTPNMLCAGYAAGGKDSCQGDSGGPLIVPDGSGGWLQAGIVSWGEGCAEPNKYGVYTRLANYTGWINSWLNPTAVVYLPLVIKTTATNPGSIPNGDFEQGDTAWTEYSSNGWDLIVNSSQMPPGSSPHGGNWAAWLGGGGGNVAELSRLYQPVTISTATPYLAFWHWIASGDLCGLDQAGVKINNQVVKSYNLCQANDTGQWQKQVVNLTAYAGQSVQLEFFVQTTATTYSAWFLDDITLQSTP